MSGYHQVDGEDEFYPAPFGLRHDLPDGGNLIRLEHRVTDLVPLGGQERVGHAAADQDPVGQVQQVADHGQLVRRLLAAEHHHEGPGRVGGELAQHRHLVPHQVSRGVREQQRQVVDGRVLAVHRAEPVAHVHLAEAGQPLRELAALGVVLAGLGRLKTHVLQHRDVLVAEAERGVLGRGPGHVGGERDGAAEQLAQPRRHRPQRRAAGRPRLERAARGPAKVREDDHPCPPVGQLADYRQAGPDPAVVGDLPGAGFRDQVQRDIQVRPEQHAPAHDLKVVDGPHYRSREATSAVRSTSRLE